MTGDEALEMKGLAKARSRFIPRPEPEQDFELRDLEDLGLMFALRNFLLRVRGSLLFVEKDELGDETDPDLPPEVNVLDLL